MYVPDKNTVAPVVFGRLWDDADAIQNKILISPAPAVSILSNVIRDFAAVYNSGKDLHVVAVEVTTDRI
ncbi:hypothetical protein N7451_007312 [Penicillium sp. IBT 35674x]|nr:hypothetical protein N7451_007312 [Penicillium sp. IBT 35674x]